MPWEALIWCAVAAIAPAVVAAYWPSAKRRLGTAGQPLGQLGPWLHGIGPAYLALIRGAILSRDAGLRGHDLLSWVGGALAGAALVWLLVLGARRYASDQPWPDPLQALADEPRWTLYRAAGALWLGSHTLGTGVGLGLGLLEWALLHKPWAAEWTVQPQAAGTLLRLSCSALVFLITRNFWLTCLAGAALLAALGRPVPLRRAEDM